MQYLSKIKIQILEKEIILTEPTVWDYYLMQQDLEDFLKKYFKKYLNILSKEEISEILQKIFIQEQNLGDILDKKKETTPLHIILAKLVKYFWNSFSDFFEMPFSLFYKILKDFKEITGEEKKEELQGLEGLKKLKFM